MEIFFLVLLEELVNRAWRSEVFTKKNRKVSIGGRSRKRGIEMSKGIKRKLKLAQVNIGKVLDQLIEDNRMMMPIPLEVVLKSEHLNSYSDALRDVSLLLDGLNPFLNKELWKEGNENSNFA